MKHASSLALGFVVLLAFALTVSAQTAVPRTSQPRLNRTENLSDIAYRVDNSASDTGANRDNQTITALTFNTWTVNKTADTNDGVCDAADCSLREAIAASQSGDSITFSALFNSPQTITLTAQRGVGLFGLIIHDLYITKDLTITGPGANLLTIRGGPSSRIFTIDAFTVNISGMTLTGGAPVAYVSSNNEGGAIYAAGALTLNHVNITGNSVGYRGGGIFAGSELSISNSTISNNHTDDRGGGIFCESGLTLVNSTISGNNIGGGIYLNGSSGTATIRNSTIALNPGSYAGIFVNGAAFQLSIGSSIVAGNAYSREINNAGGVTSVGFNLIGDSPGDAAATGIPITYQSTDILDTDPGLLPLANNGGQVPTHALSASPLSPAIDKGNAFGQTTDGRGFARTFDDLAIANATGGDGTDIGAIERLSPTAAGAEIAGQVRTANGRGIYRATVTIEGGGLASSRTVLTGPSGYYSFVDLPAGQTYIITVRSRSYYFAQPTKVVTMLDNLAGFDFIAGQ